VPPGASEARTPEYHLIAYPPSLAIPTQVVWCRSSRPAALVVEEAAAVARAWGWTELSFWVGERTTPRDLGTHLRSRGATQVESVEIFSRELLDDPVVEAAGVEVRRVLDAATLRDAELVAAEVWGSEPRPASETERLLEELNDSESTELRVVAYVDGEPACAAGCTLAAAAPGGSVARLWGGATRTSLRGRGAYRASVGARLRLARQRGADLALVKAVTTTSAPIVRRLGFTAHGAEHRFRLDLPPVLHPRG